MSLWCRPVWIDYPNGIAKEFEETIPCNWVKGDTVHWPNHMNFKESYYKHHEPTEKWKRFQLVKFKLKEGMHD